MGSSSALIDGFLISIIVIFVICACSILWQIRVCRRRRGQDRLEAQAIQRKIDLAVQSHQMQQEMNRHQQISKQLKHQTQPNSLNPSASSSSSSSSSPRLRHGFPSPPVLQSARNKLLSAVTAAAANIGIRASSGGIHQPIETSSSSAYRRPNGPPSPLSSSISSYSTNTGEQVELVTHTLDDGELEEQINLEEAEAEAEAEAQMQVEAELESHAYPTPNQPVYASGGGRLPGYRAAPTTSPSVQQDDEDEEKDDQHAI